MKPDGRNDEQINGGDVRSANAQECSRTCRGWVATPAHVPSNSRLGDADIKFELLAMDTRRAQSGLSRLIVRTGSRFSVGTFWSADTTSDALFPG